MRKATRARYVIATTPWHGDSVTGRPLPRLFVPASVGLPRGNHAANTTAGVLHVAPEARNQVDMQVLDGLSRDLAHVDANVVAIGARIAHRSGDASR